MEEEDEGAENFFFTCRQALSCQASWTVYLHPTQLGFGTVHATVAPGWTRYCDLCCSARQLSLFGPEKTPSKSATNNPPSPSSPSASREPSRKVDRKLRPAAPWT